MDPGPIPPLRRILVVDDDPISLAIASVLLEAEGFDVLQAASGEDAVGLLDCTPEPELPDCVLTDLLMPGLSGPELAGHLRAAAPRALLLAMSASPPSAVSGYDALLRKPLTPDTLRAALASMRDSSAQAPPELAHRDSLIDEAGLDRLRQAMSDQSLLEVVTAFVEDTEMRIRLIRSANPEDARRAAHTIKGGASMVAALRVSRLAAAVEAGIDDPGDRLRKVDELEYYLRRTEVILLDRLKAS